MPRRGLLLLLLPLLVAARAPTDGVTGGPIARMVALEGSASGASVSLRPKELTFEKRITWSPRGASGETGDVPAFRPGAPKALFVPLYVDAKGVNGMMALLGKMAQIDPALGRPPVCEFVWGTFRFRGIIAGIALRYTRLMADLTPRAAEVRLRLIAAKPMEPAPPP